MKQGSPNHEMKPRELFCYYQSLTRNNDLASRIPCMVVSQSNLDSTCHIVWKINRWQHPPSITCVSPKHSFPWGLSPCPETWSQTVTRPPRSPRLGSRLSWQSPTQFGNLNPHNLAISMSVCVPAEKIPLSTCPQKKESKRDKLAAGHEAAFPLVNLWSISYLKLVP